MSNGATPNAGWALTRLNDGTGEEASAGSFLYPETSTPVRLYLIDSAVSNPGGWFGNNANLTLKPTVHVGTPKSGVPMATSHATKMLSIIAGPETGAALGTPIEVVNYSIFPNGEGTSTTSGLLASALYKVIDHQELNPGVPSIVCIAIGSSSSGYAPDVESAIHEAVEFGLTVIVSAGNESAPAGNYIPSAFGSSEGVICVGASTSSNVKLAMSNFGPEVDIFSPGQDVKALNLPNPSPGIHSLMTGTSPATALATAAALAKLSLDPSLTPAELEAELKDEAYSDGSSESIVQLPPFDSDGDGVHDLIEKFYGYDPLKRTDTPSSPAVSAASVSSNGVVAMKMAFTVDSSRFNPGNPFVLSDGTSWQVIKSSDLKGWTPAEGSLQIGSSSNGKTSVSFTTSSGAKNSYLQIKITPP